MKETNFLSQKELAPIVLFVYDRPWHTKQTLEALSKNSLINQSVLYVFHDGIKNREDVVEVNRIEEVKGIVSEFSKKLKIEYLQSEKNKGLASSIVEGVSFVLKNHDNVIVLEDDIVTTKGFLKYMNDALTVYKNEEKVMHISGYMFPVKIKAHKPDTFFYNTASCWGWATWKRAWESLIVDTEFLKKEILDKQQQHQFDIGGVANFSNQLKQNSSGEINTWAVKWYASIFLKQGFCLHPKKSLVRNIGMDGTGVHFNNQSNIYTSELVDEIKVDKIKLEESKYIRSLMTQYYLRINKTSYFKSLLPKNIKDFIKDKLCHQKTGVYDDLLDNRFEETKINFLGKKIIIPDAPSFKFMYNEIFEKEIYKFLTPNSKPYIIDAGANIGLSIIYFKNLYPDALIVAFEPDPNIFSILNNNIKAFKYNDVELNNFGLWNEEKEINFLSEKADGSRIATELDSKNIIKVKTKSLRSYLSQKVDFLKIDIEGAEDIVLDDIQDLLIHVDRIFIEYHSFVGKKQSLNKIIDILTNNNFRININTPGLKSEQPFVKVQQYNGMDMQLNIYGFKI